MKFALLLLFSFSKAWGAACCGGGFASPSLIAGDERAQMTATASYSQIAADVYSSGLWKKRSEAESLQTLRLDGAHIFEDRWQAGASLPIVRRARAEESSAGLGDISATLGYEYLPDWDYHPIRPKGLGYLQLTLPTGRSVHEAENVYGLDSRGRGFWALGLGTLFTKVFRKWDVFLNSEVHRSYSKSVSRDGRDHEIEPGFGGSLGVGGGFNMAKFRTGGSITWSYEDPVRVSGDDQSSGAPQRYATVLLSGSYLINDQWAGTLSYLDQTLIGSPVNTSLGRAVSLQVQRRWQR